MLVKNPAPYCSMLLTLIAAGCADSGESATSDGGPVAPDPGTATVASVRPPPLSGGTLLVTRDAAHAIVADPDRDRIVVADLLSHGAVALALEPGDEPGRAIEDAAGRVHVALRRGGAIVSIDPASARILGRRAVCTAPRGIAFDEARGDLVVACASGEVARMSADPAVGGVQERRYLEPDLRDVAILGDTIWVSHLRGSELLRLDATLAVQGRVRPPVEVGINFDGDEVEHVPSTAWRMLPTLDGRLAMSHQLARSNEIVLDPPGDPSDPGQPPPGSAYGAVDCNDRLVHSAVTIVEPDGTAVTDTELSISSAILPADLALSRNGERLATVDAATGFVSELTIASLSSDVPCDGSDGAVKNGFVALEPVAVAYGPLHDLWVQTREPSRLERWRDGAFIDAIELGGESRADTGYALFHDIGNEATAGLACASCHPEGRDDGHTWTFSGIGPRRSQSLAGTLRGTAPYHWDGDLGSLQALMTEVFVGRMGGAPQNDASVDALATWLDALTPIAVSPEAASDLGASDRGRALFESATVGCAACHAGPALTNNTSVPVGTGAVLQVPSLIGVGVRAPYMHDGCAATLVDRFDPACGGGDQHGRTSQLSADQIADLVAYMNTL